MLCTTQTIYHNGNFLFKLKKRLDRDVYAFEEKNSLCKHIIKLNINEATFYEYYEKQMIVYIFASVRDLFWHYLETDLQVN